jgi:hypothetical protein
VNGGLKSLMSDEQKALPNNISAKHYYAAKSAYAII